MTHLAFDAKVFILSAISLCTKGVGINSSKTGVSSAHSKMTGAMERVSTLIVPSTSICTMWGGEGGRAYLFTKTSNSDYTLARRSDSLDPTSFCTRARVKEGIEKGVEEGMEDKISVVAAFCSCCNSPCASAEGC